jgi:hypothetical protein
MPGTYNVNGDILAQGINCIVRVDPDDESGSNPHEIGFVQEANIRKSINLQRAECIGEILPVALDPVSIQTTVTLRGLIPSKNLMDEGINSVRGGGTIVLKSFNPDDQNLEDTRVATKIPYLDLYDEKHRCIIGSTSWATATSYGDSISGRGYVIADVTLEAIGYNNGSDYPHEI